jgi:hypothetical protein
MQIHRERLIRPALQSPQVNCLIGEYKLNETEQLLDEIMPACREAGGQVCALSSTLGGKQTDNFGHQYFSAMTSSSHPKSFPALLLFPRASSLAFTELNRVCVCVCVCVRARALKLDSGTSRRFRVKRLISSSSTSFKTHSR